MSNKSWSEQLSLLVPRSPSRDSGSPRVTMVGIGNAMSGDDAAGVLIVEQLSEKLGHLPHLQFIPAGLAPENFTGVIRAFKPDLLLFVDTALFGEPAGSIDLFGMDQLAGLTFSTHTLPPAIIADYLAEACACNVHLIGLQPVSTGFGNELSPEMQTAITEAVDTLAGLLA